MKGGGHGHYIFVCLSKSLHFCVEEPEFELENYPKKRRPTMKMNLDGVCFFGFLLKAI